MGKESKSRASTRNTGTGKRTLTGNGLTATKK